MVGMESAGRAAPLFVGVLSPRDLTEQTRDIEDPLHVPRSPTEPEGNAFPEACLPCLHQDFEVGRWIDTDAARERMADLLD
jgi:hypothetical protein